jgi:phosphate-selective porin OprO/OprP
MKNFQFVFTSASLFLALCQPSPALLAQNSGTNWPDSSLLRRAEEIDQKQRILERRWEIEKENATGKAKAAPAMIAGKDGFSLKSEDGSYVLKLRANTQMDVRYFNADEARLGTNTFVIRRLRFIFEGTLAQFFDFKFMPDFAGSRLVLQDSYLDARLWPQLKFKAGKFKTPFGIERLQSHTNMLFVERALPNNLVPNRDTGLQLHGDLAGGIFSYAVGFFNGVLDGGSSDIDLSDGKDCAARLMISPFLKTPSAALRNLSVGVAATTGKQEGTISSPDLPTYVTPGLLPIFRYRANGTAAGTVIANGKRQRLSPQGYYSWGRFGLLGEYVVSSNEVSRAATSARLEHNAWQLAASFSLTGEPASYKGLTPEKAFDRAAGVFGSFEIVARYNALEIDEDAFPVFSNPQTFAQKATAWAAGLNWYLNRNVKFMLNYEQTAFKGGAASGNRQDEKAFLTRFQIAY